MEKARETLDTIKGLTPSARSILFENGFNQRITKEEVLLAAGFYPGRASKEVEKLSKSQFGLPIFMLENLLYALVGWPEGSEKPMKGACINAIENVKDVGGAPTKRAEKYLVDRLCRLFLSQLEIPEEMLSSYHENEKYKDTTNDKMESSELDQEKIRLKTFFRKSLPKIVDLILIIFDIKLSERTIDDLTGRYLEQQMLIEQR